VVVVTGAGNGLGRAYALEFARRGACVLVNDAGCAIDGTGASRSVADAVVEEISSVGARAVASHQSVATGEGGEEIIAAALDAFGRIDALVSNAGILSNAPFHEMSADQFEAVTSTNLMGAIHVAQAAYRIMREQRYGRLVFASSGAGLFGARNEANYAAAKAGLIGLSNVLAIEGADFNIMSNVIAPAARTRMEEGIRAEDIGEDQLRLLADPALPSLPSTADHVVPLVMHLASEVCTQTQGIFSSVGGRFARVFIGVTQGWYGPADRPATPEEFQREFARIDDRSNYYLPASVYDELAIVRRAAPGGGHCEAKVEGTSLWD
jgi:NAD(P)-dependent dehydrogenase (short-subunit alcohol dehydrogenase family)